MLDQAGVQLVGRAGSVLTVEYPVSTSNETPLESASIPFRLLTQTGVDDRWTPSARRPLIASDGAHVGVLSRYALGVSHYRIPSDSAPAKSINLIQSLIGGFMRQIPCDQLHLESALNCPGPHVNRNRSNTFRATPRDRIHPRAGRGGAGGPVVCTSAGRTADGEASLPRRTEE